MTRTSVGLRFTAATATATATAIATAIARRSALVLAVVSGAAGPLVAQDPVELPSAESRASSLYTVEELDNLLAPVALYPDPILAQLLVAATYPDEIALAQRYVRTYGDRDLDEQPWNLSVRAIAHYAPVLNLLADRPDWATALGQAYAMQPGDVMASVQSLRRMANAQGNLQTTREQRVEIEPDEIRIVPAQPRVVYVPVYDPEIVYVRPVHYHRVRTTYWSFGVGFPIGDWLSVDFDWGRRVVYYHGWNHYGYSHRWYHVSRPYIAIRSIYVGRHVSVSVNHYVTRRRVHYDHFGRYNTVHRRVSWDRRDLPGRYGYERWERDDDRSRYGIPSGRNAIVNKPGKPEVDRVVPVVNRNTGPDRGSDRGGDRGGNGGYRPDRNRDDDRNRVQPIRIGGRTGGEQDDGKGDGRRDDGRADNGSWSPRKGDAGRYAPGGGRSGAANSGGSRELGNVITRRESYDAPKSAPRANPPRQYTPRADVPRSVVPRGDAPRSAPSRYDAPRSVKSPKASAERSSPRASEPRASAPRASAPRAERGSFSAPRGGGGGGGGGGKSGKGSKGSK